MKQLRQLFILAFALLVMPSFAFGEEISLRLVGIESITGKAFSALFASAADYAVDHPRQVQARAVKGDTVEFVFSDVSPGSYGISAFQDLNASSELDRSLIGLPKEPYGFSNNVRGRFGPPEFEVFSFIVGDEPVTVEIELK